MVNLRRCEFSSNLFGGFVCSVDVDEWESLREIVQQAVKQLDVVLTNIGLFHIADILKQRQFDIHDCTFEEILLQNDSVTLYICDHITQDARHE